MKKLVRIILAMMLMITASGIRASASTEYTLTLDTEISVTASASDPVICYFTPSEPGFYTFESLGYVYTICKYTDEAGDVLEASGSPNFSFAEYLEENTTYAFEVRIDSYYSSSQTFTVRISKTWATAFNKNVTVPVNSDVKLKVAGTCLIDENVDYQWYIFVLNTSSNSWTMTPITDRGHYPSYTVHEVSGYSWYACCIRDTTDNDKQEEVQFFIRIESDFTISMYPVTPAEKNSTVRVQCLVSGDATGAVYNWYYSGSSRPDRVTDVPYIDLAVRESSIYVQVSAYDRFGNSYYANTTVSVDFEYPAVEPDAQWTLDEEEDHRIFYCLQDGKYLIHTTGDSKAYIIVTDMENPDTPVVLSYGESISPEAETGNACVILRGQKGKQYLIRTGSFQYESNLVVTFRKYRNDKPNILLAVNNLASVRGIVVRWDTNVKDADKFSVCRRKKGDNNWTKLAEIAADTLFYVDQARLSMGTTYEYAVRQHTASGWSGYSVAEEVFFNPFPDVADRAATTRYVAWAYNKGVVSGIDGNYEPSALCSRAQLAIMLYKINGKPKVSGTNPFEDIDAYSGNVKKAILWCYKKGIVTGTSATTYAPDDNVTRQQMAIMLWRMAGKPSTKTVDCFNDIDGLSPTAQKAIMWCYNKGISKGIKDSETGEYSFDPFGNVTRLQLAVFLYKYNAIYHLK